MENKDFEKYSLIALNLVARFVDAGADFEEAKALAFDKLNSFSPEVMAAWLHQAENA